MEVNVSAFEVYDKDWALVTAGTEGSYNTMTISWGGIGTLWSKPVVTVYVKPIRYTWQFLEENEYFTVSFYPEECRLALQVMGSESGRNCDKESMAGLTPKELSGAVTFEEAQVTLLCRKIYFQDLDLENMPQDVVRNHYTVEEPHRMYIGEVLEMIDGCSDTEIV